MDRWLCIESPYFVAACVFRRDPRGRWLVVDAAPILRWRLLGRDAEQVKTVLVREGWKWGWLSNVGD